MWELLWLLLPVAAASGWYAGRRNARTIRLHTDYLTGLNFVINEQPERAIEHFARMLETDADAVEVHLALGSLFRRRGEVDRAIRVHQNLVARPRLDTAARDHALYELACDYLKAGLLDRAEQLFEQLRARPRHAEPALRRLVEIFEREQEWDRAIEACTQLERRTGVRRPAQIAHYYCEQAAAARADGRMREALERVKRALAADPDGIRPYWMRGQYALESGEPKRALEHLRRVAERAPQYAVELADAFEAAFAQLGDRDGFRGYFGELSRRHPEQIAPAVVHARALLVAGELAAARTAWQQALGRHPHWLAVRGLVDTLARQGEWGADSIALLQEGVTRLAQREPVYQCRQCGFQGGGLRWQCPACREWDSLQPLTGYDLKPEPLRATG